MHCPDCQYQLETIDYRPIAKDISLKINYCPSCGGFWLDSTTVNNLELEDVQNLISGFDLATSYSSAIEQFCPQCLEPLQSLRAESLPQFTRVFTCQKCNYRWFPSGELLNFKKAQKAKLNYFKEWKIPLKSVYAILLPVLLLVPLAIGYLQTRQPTIYYTVPEESGQESIIGNLNINYPSPSQAKIVFKTAFPATSKIEYGPTDEGVKRLIISSQPVLNHSLVLSSLKPGEKYWYRLIVKYNGKTEVGRINYFIP